MLGPVDVVSGLGAHLLAIRQSNGSAYGLVIFFTGGQDHDVLPLQGLGNLAEQLAVLFHVFAAHDGNGHGHNLGHSLGVGHTRFHRAVQTVGIGRLKMQHQEIGAGHGLCLLGIVGHGLTAGIELHQLRSGPLLGQIGNLHANLGRVFHRSVKGVEGQDILTAQDHGLVAGAQGDGVDLRIERLRFGNERHNWYPPC